VRRLDGAPARIVFGALLLLWCVGIFVLSSQSDPEDYVGVPFRLNDKVAHGVAYAVGGVFAAGAFGFLSDRRRIAAAIAFCGLWGVSDEWHQSVVPGRSASAADLAADVVGASVGGLAFALLASRAQAPRRSVDESDKREEARGRT
jgi:VanZ family protein